MRNFARKLSAAGELVGAEGLSGPDQAKRVRAGAGGEPITDGVFPESKEFLAGYWIVDVDTPERAYAIAAEASAAPGPGGKPLNLAIEVRQVMSGPPSRLDAGRVIPRLDNSAQDLLRDLAPTVLGALVRRYRDFGGCEDAVQEALLAAAMQWPTQGMPDNPKGWLITVATRRLTDQIRADTARRLREHLVVSLIPADEQIALGRRRCRRERAG